MPFESAVDQCIFGVYPWMDYPVVLLLHLVASADRRRCRSWDVGWCRDDPWAPGMVRRWSGCPGCRSWPGFRRSRTSWTTASRAKASVWLSPQLQTDARSPGNRTFYGLAPPPTCMLMKGIAVNIVYHCQLFMFADRPDRRPNWVVNLALKMGGHTFR